MASLAVIRAILQDIPLGKHKVEIGLEPRQALFIHSVLFNSKTLHGLKKTDIADIDIIDHQLLRFICSAHAKTPVEFLYMETGSVPISHIISQRTINYLYEIVNRNDSELVKRIYTVQKDNPTKGDFVVLVEEDLRMIGEDPNNCNLFVLSKNYFKNHIKSEIRKVAFAEFKHVQESHLKVKEIP